MEISKELSAEATSQKGDLRKEETDESERQDTATPKSPSLFTKADPNPPFPTFFHARDNDFTTQTWRVKSEVQAGHVSGGHYLRINGGRVSADAARNNRKAQFNIHCYYELQLDEDVWIFESASDVGKCIAIVNNRVVVKHVKIPLTSISHVKATNPDILFVKTPIFQGSEVFTLRLFTSSKKLYLGFDKINGSVMDPTKVRPSQKEAKFRIV